MFSPSVANKTPTPPISWNLSDSLEGQQDFDTAKPSRKMNEFDFAIGSGRQKLTDFRVSLQSFTWEMRRRRKVRVQPGKFEKMSDLII